MRDSDFAKMRAFLLVAEFGSFARAAEVMGVAPSTLTYHIQELEKHFGMTLLHRTTRKAAPTDAGQRLSERLKPMMLDFERIVSDMEKLRFTPAGTLRLCVPRMPMQLYMEPLLQGFEAAYPDITIDLTISDVPPKDTGEEFDVIVAANRHLREDLVAITLAPRMPRIIYASPDYIGRFGRPERPEDLRAHNCINFKGPGSREVYHWEFERDGTPFNLQVSGSLIVSDSAFMLSAALKGKGIGYGIAPISAEHIKAGRLVSLLPEWTAWHPGFVFCYPKVAQKSAVLSAFVAYIRRGRAASKALQM